LGIKDVGRFNATLVAKWKWELQMEEVGVWRDTLESRYGTWRDMRVTMADRKSSSWWRDLCRISDAGNQFNWFKSTIRWKLENGNQISFWDDM